MVKEIKITTNALVSRAGLCTFNAFIENNQILEMLENEFSHMRKSKKSELVSSIMKQLINYFADGTNFTLTRFDELKREKGYARLLNLHQNNLLSSHQVKRFFNKFSKEDMIKFRNIIRNMFIKRLKSEKPDVVILNIDTMVMDNDDAKKREGVEYTYKRVKGFQPLQLTWNNFIIDGRLRSGKTHSNYGHEALEMIISAVKAIRKGYGAEVPIIVRFDSGFFDIENFKKLDELDVGFIGAGKLYSDIYDYVENASDEEIQTYDNQRILWNFIEFGNSRKTWNGKFYRTIFTRQSCDENLQMVLPTIRKESLIYTNIGVNKKVSKFLSAAGHSDYLKGERIIQCYHSRGRDELIHRALKEFGTERLPFKRIDPNTAFYYIMLISFFLYEIFKQDITKDVFPAESYAVTFRRRFLDIAGKIVKTAGGFILKVTREVFEKFDLQKLFLCANNPSFTFT